MTGSGFIYIRILYILVGEHFSEEGVKILNTSGNGRHAHACDLWILR